ncbi:MAG: Gfo/Idh/MocA family oxidoreductase [Alphaproteobacteria bacterium]|nr:Gfo/Idh/MocA family oxidoreductase [Alphaproteobacteria bacterium]MBV9371329.1 Gfo/Idh/MocA family oxidoreductase [Alphaproteobacteria bacterium]MBV9901793.1 Gfo/Idh/MocA family oxidoreductase [Alphaproteobacteria bacterium]
MSRLRVGLLGCGGIAARHAGAVAALADEMALVACCGRDPARTGRFAAEHGCAAFTDVDRMIDAGLDLMVAALPPFAGRAEIARAAARGVHLLVEKPIALDEETARRLVASVEASGVVAAVGFMYRFGDAVRRWQASDGGRVGLFAGSYHCNALHAPWWREREKSGGQMVEQLIHLVDLVRLFMGEPSRVYARAANLFHGDVPGYDAEDVAAIVFGWEDGRIAALNAGNIAIPGRWDKQWSLYAERMTGHFSDWNHAVLTPTAPPSTEERIAGGTDPFVAQLADVAAAIRERRSPTVPLREGLLSLALALAARRSADEGRELRLGDGD